jgi:formate dehydrogenase subunit gamma
MGAVSESVSVRRARAPRVERFSGTERTLHWAHAVGFFVMLATGLILYLPGLAAAVGRRDFVKNVHIWTALAWALAIGATVVLGNRRRLAEAWREVQTIDPDDRRWLARGGKAPQGRFNAGQKVNTIASVAFALLFAISGVILWLGERDHRFMLAGAGTLHDVLTWASVALVSGHLYLAVIHPTTRHALAGMTTGRVRADWARKHHSKWMDAVDREAHDPPR